MTNKGSIVEIKDSMGALGTNIKEAMSNSVDGIKYNISEYYKKGKTGVKEAEAQVQDKIKKYPLLSILLSVGVGIVLGLACNKEINVQA